MNRINKTCFLSQDEFAKNMTELSLKTTEYASAGIPLLCREQSVYVDTSDSHSIIFGATGSRKTRMLVMPTIELLGRAGESFVVTDPKGELYEKTAGDIKNMGYRVSCLDLRELDNSTNWNPFLLPFDCYKHNEQRKAMELLGEMVSLIVNDDSVDEQFWNNTAKDVIVGFILLMFENASREECHIKSLLSLWQSYLDDKEKILDMIKKYEDHFIMQSKLSCLYSSSDKTVGSIETMVTMGLNRFIIT